MIVLKLAALCLLTSSIPLLTYRLAASADQDIVSVCAFVWAGLVVAGIALLAIGVVML